MRNKSVGRQERRVLLIPATRRDGEAIRKVLQGVNIDCDACGAVDVFSKELNAGAATLIVAEEILKSNQAQLARWIEAQPVWSDLPLIVLSRAGVESPWLTASLPGLGNVTVLERPIRISTLLSVVQSSLRARMRQYQSRDYLEEREQLLSSEQYARSESERAGRLKDEFLTTLSHELRTPLSAIMGWAQILGMRPSDKDVHEGARVIERNARVQSQLIEDLLDMGRIVSGKIRLHVGEVDLAEVVHSAVDTVRTAAVAKGIRLQLVLDSEAGKVSGDPDRLQQVLWNLLSNSIKFTPRGGSVCIVLEKRDSQVLLTVMDSGEGIAAEFLPRVFDRFQQADGTMSRPHGGLGLGLSIVKQLIELHGGTIHAESEGLGRGASFIVSLPIRGMHTKVEATRVSAESGESPYETRENSHVSLEGVRILVLDNEPDVRDLLRRLLESERATVIACESSRQAMEVLERGRVDLIISDIGMPVEDGYTFLRRVREKSSEEGGLTPAVALTAYARPEDRIAALQAGFQHHLTKPIEPGELIAVVASLVRR